MNWTPTWTLPDEPAGEDEWAAESLYLRAWREDYPNIAPVPWGELDEWKRQAWRRELRDQ